MVWHFVQSVSHEPEAKAELRAKSCPLPAGSPEAKKLIAKMSNNKIRINNYNTFSMENAVDQGGGVCLFRLGESDESDGALKLSTLSSNSLFAFCR